MSKAVWKTLLISFGASLVIAYLRRNNIGGMGEALATSQDEAEQAAEENEMSIWMGMQRGFRDTVDDLGDWF